MITCASPSYLSEKGEPKTVEELSGQHGVRSLSGQSNRPLAWQFIVEVKERKYGPRSSVTVNQSGSYVQRALAGFEIVQPPGVILDAHLATGALVEILRPFRPRQRRVTILNPSQSYLSPVVDIFVEWLKARFPELHPTWFAPISRVNV